MKFPRPESRIQFPAAEAEVLELWRAERIFQRSVEERPADRVFSFYDGPPFATGLPHYGHLLAGTIKDVVPRYWTMRGYRVPRRFGWDCHGLPVEFEVEKELGLKGRRDIERYGVARFNEACRSIVLRYADEWRRIVERMGRWVDFDNEYRTMDLSFMESVWWAFRQLWDQGLVYEDYRVVPYSWRIGAPLSNFEANLNYRQVQDPSIAVRFRLENGLEALVWTTTPWTLPSNLALAVDPSLDYAVVESTEEPGVRFVLLAERVDAYWPGREGIRVVSTVPGRDLVGLRYEPLFDFFADRAQRGAFRVLPADFIETDTGTGIVHIAPAYGEVDFELCKQHGIELVDPVDDEGRFTEAVPPWAGVQVKEADRAIIAELKRRGRLFRHDTVEHSYPFCYRSDTPLIYKAIRAWYVRVEVLRDRMLEHNASVHWVPGHIREGRFGNWLRQARDWNISRNRFWGNPIPVWRNEETGETLCIGSRAELERHSGRKVTDLHKHIVDDIEIPSPTGRGVLRRVPEVLDCWFESGSMPYAQEHYPFERREEFERSFPADFIAEGIDQTRGWFYTLLVLSTALFDKPAYRNVIVNGLVLAADGRKMSKRLRNYPDPDELITKFGADAIRLYMLQSPAVRAEELRFSERGVHDMVRRVLLPWWNAFVFLATYASVDGWDPAEDRHEGEPTHELDVWVRARLKRLAAQVQREMERYELSRVVPPLLDFIGDLTNWYIRRSRRRFWKSASDEDKRSAYTTLYDVLLALSEMMAPFAPFFAEYVYQRLRLTPETQSCDSVHLRFYPTPEPLSEREREVEARQDLARLVVDLGRELRDTARIRTRQPLGVLEVAAVDPQRRAWLAEVRDVVLDELNVKELKILDDPAALARLRVVPNWRRLGPRLGPRMKAVAAALQRLPAEQVHELAEGRAIEVEGERIEPDDVEVRVEPLEAGHLVAARGEVALSLDATITPELRAEGLARELINRIQRMRKEADYPVDARVEVEVVASGELRAAIEAHEAMVRAETLARALRVVDDISLQPDVERTHTLDGHEARVAIRRVSAA